MHLEYTRAHQVNEGVAATFGIPALHLSQRRTMHWLQASSICWAPWSPSTLLLISTRPGGKVHVAEKQHIWTLCTTGFRKCGPFSHAHPALSVSCSPVSCFSLCILNQFNELHDCSIINSICEPFCSMTSKNLSSVALASSHCVKVISCKKHFTG